MLFKTHPANIAQIRATVATFGACYFHGDGNIYSCDPVTGRSEDSDFRKDFSNQISEEAQYRVKFQRGDRIPRTVEELNKMLFESKNQEILAKRTITQAGGVKTVTVTDQDYGVDAVAEDAEVDYSKYKR